MSTTRPDMRCRDVYVLVDRSDDPHTTMTNLETRRHIVGVTDGYFSTVCENKNIQRHEICYIHAAIQWLLDMSDRPRALKEVT